ncbi:glycoside hydrolase family 30 beta sandwich domain-containing protein [Sinomonas flava]
MQDLWDTVSYIESFPGQTVSLSVMGGVPDWMGGTSIQSSKEAYWVRMIASLLMYGRTERHLTLNLISPVNESDWNGTEGPKSDPQQLTRLLDSLGHRLDSLGMGDVRFVVPDTSSPEEARTRYLPAVLANPFVLDKTARIGIHSYDGSAGSVPDLVAQGSAASKGVWATEFNARCDGCDTGTQPSATWDHAQSMARVLLSLISQGVTGAQLYDGWDGYYEHHRSLGYWGALKYDAATGTYAPRRTFDVFSLFLTAVPPGSVHIASAASSSGGEAGVDVQAFLSADGRVTVVGINHSGTAAHLRVTSSAAQLSAPTLTVASPDADGVGKAATPQIDGNALLLTIPEGAVFVAAAAR